MNIKHLPGHPRVASVEESITDLDHLMETRLVEGCDGPVGATGLQAGT